MVVEFFCVPFVQAALLHDTVEDTDTSMEELESVFGKTVRGGYLLIFH